MDANKTPSEKARWELHKNATTYSEKIQEAAPHKTTAVWPLTSHLKNHPSITGCNFEDLLGAMNDSDGDNVRLFTGLFVIFIFFVRM